MNRIAQHFTNEIDGQTFPIGKMLCLGRNYQLHAKEMGSKVPTTPVIFTKPSTAYLPTGGEVIIPSISSELHHEVELVLLIGKRLRNVSEEEGMDGVIGYAIGLDMTLRDIQAAAKVNGEPWTVAKGFDTSAPIGPFVGRDQIQDPHDLRISLTVNDEIRQEGWTGDMIFKIPFVISYLSTIFTLEPGDCIFTGTPEGVSQVVSGDRLVASVDSHPEMRLEVTIA